MLFYPLFFSATTEHVSLCSSFINPYLYTPDNLPVDTAAKRSAYLLAVALIASAVLLSPFLVLFARAGIFQKVRPWLLWLAPAITGCFFLLSCFYWQPNQPFLILSITVLPVIAFYAPRLTESKFNREILLWTVALIAIASLPGFVTPLDLSGLATDHITLSLRHYASVLAQGDRLAAGYVLNDFVRPGYGLLLPMLTAGWQRNISVIDMQGYVLILRAFQILFLAVGTFLYWTYSRRQLKIGTLMALAILLPWYQFNHMGLLYPNNTAWRLIAFPLALLAVWCLRKKGLIENALILGGTAGLSVIHNFETGIATSAGLAAYICLRFDLLKPKNALKLLQVLAGMAAAALIADGAFCAVYKLTMGYWPGLAHLETLLEMTGIFARAGYGGTNGSFNPLAALIFAHAAFVMIRTALDRGKELSFKQSFRACVATIILVWYAYYVHQTREWYVTAYLFLYGFLFIDLLEYVFLAIGNKRAFDYRAVIATLCLAVVIFPQTFSDWFHQSRSFREGWQTMLSGPAKKDAVKISGVYLPRTFGAELIEKAEYLRQKSKTKPATYFTANPFLIGKLSGVYPPLKVADPCMSILSRKTYSKQLESLKSEGPEFILLDVGNSVTSGGRVYNNYYNRFRKDISTHYRQAETRSRWEIWKRISPVVPVLELPGSPWMT